MVIRIIFGIVGIAGLVVGVSVFVYESRTRHDPRSRRERFYDWMFSLDSFMPAFGWATWIGVFGAFVSYSITGEANR